MLFKIEPSNFYLYNHLGDKQQVHNMEAQKHYNSGDTFKLKIDFKSKSAEFYGDNTKLIQETFNSNTIYPKLVLFWEKTVIEITNSKFSYC